MPKIKFLILFVFTYLALIANFAYATPKVLLVPIENGGMTNNFEQLRSYNRVLKGELSNSSPLYPVISKDSGLLLNSAKPRPTKFKNQPNTGKRSFYANQTSEIARKNNVDYLLHSNVLAYDGAIINARGKNITIDSPTVSGTIGVSLIRPSDAYVIWYYETTAKVNTNHYKLDNGIHGGRKDVDDVLYYSLLEKLCKDIAKRIKTDIKLK